MSRKFVDKFQGHSGQPGITVPTRNPGNIKENLDSCVRGNDENEHRLCH